MKERWGLNTEERPIYSRPQILVVLVYNLLTQTYVSLGSAYLFLVINIYIVGIYTSTCDRYVKYIYPNMILSTMTPDGGVFS